MDSTTVAVSGAGGNIGSNMVAALRSAPDRRLVGTEANRYHRLLATTDETYRVPYATRNPDAYLDRLAEVLETADVDAFLPSNIMEIKVVVGADLPAATFLPDPSTVATFADKWAAYEAWREADLPVPETHLLRHPADVGEAFDRIGTDRVWVRGAAREDPLAVAGRVFTDPEIVRCWVDHHDGWGEFTAGEYLLGADCTWLGVYDGGELVCSQGRERLDYAESESWGAGAPSVSRTVSCDGVNRLGRLAVERVVDDPHGVFFTDMRADRDGRLRLTEVNPGRLGTTSSAFYPRAGFDVVSIMVDLALGRSPPDLPRFDVLDTGLYYVQKMASEPALVTEDEIDAE